jgi:S-adenosylmethionine:tRNA ribosyltransferase-isomerase
MQKSDFHFDLPESLVAQAPLAERSASRLLRVDARERRLDDRRFADLPGLLAPGDLLVFNDTRVIPARLFARKDSGGEAEVLLERVVGAHEVVAQVRASKALREGRTLALDDGTVLRVLGREGAFYRLAFETAEPLADVLARVGHMPLPPYIRRADAASDRERYQTVFAATPGAVAAPTAGLHFDAPLLAALDARGIGRARVTLHVGAGTFQPLRVDDPRQHEMHSEWLEVGAGVVQAIAETRARGGRVVAVGTTVVRALETAAQGGRLAPYAGETQIFILPGHRFRCIDALVTNFHLPESTLLMLVSAFAGREFVLEAYRHAVAQAYRFFSYGDAMLVFPAPEALAGGAGLETCPEAP